MEERGYKNILLKVESRIATVTINREQLANAMDHETLGEIVDAFDWAGKSNEVGAIVLTGAGKHFSSGGNIKKFKLTLESGDYIHKEGAAFAGDAVWRIFSTPKPTIAMINGAAAGQGASIAAACDFRVFGPSSRFIMAFINIGLSGDSGSMLYLTKLIGIAKAKELMMTGRAVRAEEAERIGLATLVAESDDQLSTVCYDFAAKLANGPTFAYSRQKELFSEIYYTELQKYTELECSSLELCSRHPDFREAVFAFCDKRPPVFGKYTEGKS